MIKAVHKLLLTTTLTLAAYNSYAALYRVVESDSPADAEESYGIGIEKESGTTNCFDSDTNCGDDDYDLAGDTLNGTDGISYKEEVAFGIGNRFNYLDYDDLEDYCDSELGYSTCEYWAYLHWYGNTDNGIGGLENEREAYWEADYQTNATAYSGNTTLIFEPDEGTDAPSGLTTSSGYYVGEEDKVINAINDGGDLIGNTSSGYYNYNYEASSGYYVRLYRSRGFYYDTDSDTATVLEPEADTSLTLADNVNEDDDANYEQNIVAQMGRTMAFDSFTYDSDTYVVGSAAVAPFYYEDDDEIKDYDSAYTSTTSEEDVTNCVDYTDPALYPECQNFGFATRAFIWNITDGPNEDANRFYAADWETDSSDYYEYNDDEASAQASIRAAVISTTGTYSSYPVLVGYNTYIDDYDNFLMQAAVFRPSSTSSFSVSEGAWSTTFIEDATVEVDDAYIHSNSVATDINENMIVIGYAKRDGDYPSGGVTDKRMFLADANDDTPTAAFFNSQGEDIFFSSAGGNANAINNYNEIVGQVDAETNDEVSGKQRDHRGFIYPYNDTGTDSTRRARFKSQAWWLDDLTNGGDYSSANNHFRIIDAGDINDAGVISATAIQCYADESATTSMEYDSTDHFAYCNDGSGDERIVAVKLIPISGATSSDISEREEDTSTVSRSGAGLGWISLLLMTLFGFVRNKVLQTPMSRENAQN